MSKRFGRYILNEELGRGGMGVVYKAYDTTLKQQVALKIVLQQQNMKRFLQECSVMSNLQHPNIVNFLGFGDSPYPYFTMEYIAGVSLADFIREKKLTTIQILDILIPISEALSYMHHNNILHRDIKPSNIMITQNGVAKLMDFGLAKTHNDESLSKTGDIIGTIAYMSPEQLTGNVTSQSDIYSLGATMYEALTCKKVFDGETHASILFQVWHDEPVLPRQINKRISPYVEAVCLKCLEKNPEKRYASFKELISDLKNLKRNRPILAKKYNSARHFFHIITRYKVLSCIVLISFVLLTTLSGCLFYFLQQMRNANANVRQEKKSIAFKLSNVALREAREAQQDLKWNNTGGLAGAALEFVKSYDEGTKFTRERAEQHLKEALFYSKLLWRYPGVYAGDKRLKQILYSQDDKSLYSVEENAISLWDTTSAKLQQRFLMQGEISDASCAGKNIVLTIRGHVDKGVYIFDTDTHQFRRILSSIPSILTANEKRLVACYEKKMHILNLAMGNSYEINIPGKMRSLCIDQSSRLLAGIFRNTIYVWDLHKRKILHKIFRENVDHYVQFSCEGSIIFIENGKLSLFNLQSKNVQHFDHVGRTIFLIASPTAEKFALMNEESILVFNCRKQRLVLDQRIPAPKYSFYIKGCFSNKQNIFACAEYSVVRYDLVNGKKMNLISSINSSVETISWSPDARKILTLNFDRVLRIWDAKNGELLSQIDSDGAFYCKFIDNQNFVTYCSSFTTGKRNRYLLFYSLQDNTSPRKVSVRDFCVDISPKNKSIASYDDGNIMIKTLAGQLVQKIPFAHKLRYIRFHPHNDSLILITEKSVYLWREKAFLLFDSDNVVVNVDYDASGRYALLQENSNVLHVVDLHTRQRIKKLIINSKEVLRALFTSDVKKILCLSHNGSFVVDSTTMDVTEVEKRATAIAISPQKNLIAKGFSNSALSVEVAMPCLKMTSQTFMKRQPKHSVVHAQLSNDESKTAISYSNNKVRIYNTKSFNPPVDFSFREKQLYVDFDVNNKLLMCMGAYTFHVYDLSTGKNTEFEASKPGFFIKAVFHPTQQQVFSSLLNSKKVYEIRLWNIETQTYEIVAQHRKFILDFAISSDGEKLFVLESFGNITIWDVPRRQKVRELELVNSNDNKQNYLYLRNNTLISVGYKTIFIWELSSLNKRVQWSIPHINSACLSFDGQYLLIATNKNTQLREVSSGKLFKEFPIVTTCISSYKLQHKYLLGKANGNSYLLDIDSLPKSFDLSSHYRDFFVDAMKIQMSSFDFRSDFPGVYIEKLLRTQPQELSEVLFGIHVDESLQTNVIKCKKLW